jgi:hypothetical protein
MHQGSLEQLLRERIVSSDLTINGIARASGVQQQGLWTFARKGGRLRSDTVDRLLRFFSLEVREARPDSEQ